MAALPFAPAAAGAGVVAATLRVLPGIGAHEFGRGPIRPEELAHGLHRLGDMVEEVLVARARA